MQGQQSQSGAAMPAAAGATAVNMPILMQGQPGQHPMMYGTLDQFAVMLQRQQDAPVAWDPATCLITPKVRQHTHSTSSTTDVRCYRRWRGGKPSTP